MKTVLTEDKTAEMILNRRLAEEPRLSDEAENRLIGLLTTFAQTAYELKRRKGFRRGSEAHAREAFFQVATLLPRRLRLPMLAALPWHGLSAGALIRLIDEAE